MDIRGLERLADLDRVRRQVAHASGTAATRATINALAAERVLRDQSVRSGFARIFAATNVTAEVPGTVITPSITLALGSAVHRKLSAQISANLSPGSSGDVVVDFFEGKTLIGSETYSVTAAVRASKAGEDYARWALEWQGTAHSAYKGPISDLQEVDAAISNAEDTQAMLWEALADPSRNPEFAANVAALEQQQ